MNSYATVANHFARPKWIVGSRSAVASTALSHNVVLGPVLAIISSEEESKAPHTPARAHAAARAFMESAGNISGLTLDDSALMSSEDEREARGARASQATTMAPAYCKPGARVSVAARDFNLPEDIKNGIN